MNSITAFEAKTRFGELLDRVARGEEIIITRHDKPVARVVREGGPSRAQVREAIEGLREVRRSIDRRTKGKAKLSDAEARSAINEGRM